ncbi:MAG: glycosyltransferase family 4 protein [Capsulimonadales bacterium]|nr:glycosyltransferase family 4 protein [Capsulimonadales bacterium]
MQLSAIDNQTANRSRVPGDTVPTRRFTVLFLDHTAKWSGGEIALLRTLEALDRDRYRAVVALAADGPFADRLREIGIETHILPLSEEMREVRKGSLGGGGLAGKFRAAVTFAGYANRIARFARSIGADLLHCNSLKADIYGALAGRIARIPVLWHVRDHIDPSYLPAPVVRVFRRLAKSWPQYVLTNSESTRAALFPDGSGQQRVKAVHDGLSETELTSPPPSAGTEWKNSPPRIGMVGRLVEWKGQHVFLEAALRLSQSGRRLEFVLIGAALFGEEDYEARLRQQAEAIRSAGGEVVFTGFRTDIRERLRDLDIFVHASITPEPFGQVVIEAMAEGLPVIGSDGGGVREILRTGETGILTPMNDAVALGQAIERLLDNPAEAGRLSGAGYAEVRSRFTAAHNARQVEAAYEEMLGRKA